LVPEHPLIETVTSAYKVLSEWERTDARITEKDVPGGGEMLERREKH
jgi:hypothetical protein